MKKLINDYIKAIELVKQRGEEIAEKICEAVSDIIPDISYTLGWAEAGIDTICFWSDKRDTGSKYHNGERFEEIVEEVFPELSGYVDTPFGVYLTESEAEKVKEKLEELKE